MMKAFFKKLDSIAERWLNTLDGELHQPVMRTITGDVFTHGTASVGHLGDKPQAQANAYLADVDGECDRIDEGCDAVLELMNPVLSVPAMPKAGASLLVT